MKNIEAIFIDRDGTIGGTGKLLKPGDFELFPFSKNSIQKLKENGIYVFAFTNQPGISRKETTYDAVANQLKSYGFDDIFICPHCDNDNCLCRKPQIGLLEQAKNKYSLDFNNCYIIGDSWRDMLAAHNANVNKILVKTGDGLKSYIKLKKEHTDVSIDYVADDLLEAVEFIIDNNEK